MSCSRVAVRRPLFAKSASLPSVLGAGIVAVALSLGAAPAWAQAPSKVPSDAPIMPGAQPKAPAAPADDSDWTCTIPHGVPKIPDGHTASEADMRKAHDVMKDYVDIGQGFIACVDRVVSQHPDKITVNKYLELTHVQDLVVNNMEILADRFNQQLRLYKAREAGKKGPTPKPAEHK